MQLLELSLDMKRLVVKITELNIWKLKFKSKSLTLIACLALFSMYPLNMFKFTYLNYILTRN